MSRSPPQRRIAAVLGAACAVATALLFPYVLALQPGALTSASASLHLPIWAVVLVQSLGNGVVCFLLAWAGLKLGAGSGLQAPWLAARLYGRTPAASPAWLLAALLGAGAGLLVLAAIAVFGAPIANPVGTSVGDSSSTRTAAALFALKGLLASPYGAIAEEVQMRVFTMGLFAWLLGRFSGKQAAPWIVIVAIALAALLFGAGHLPLAAKLVPLTPDVVTRVIAYNALPGLVFGWLYWRRGLEHAMLAHFCADLVLHVGAPAFA